MSPTWVPEPAQIRVLDRQISQALNGDGGGSWEPTSPITIGGSGVALSGSGGFTGGIATGVRALPGALKLSGPFPGDYPIYTVAFGNTPVARTRKIIFSLNGYSTYHEVDDRLAASESFDFSIPGRVRVVTTSSVSLYANIPSTFRFPYQGIVTEVRLRFKVGIRPTAVPTAGNLPAVNFNIGSTSGSAHGTYASVAAYYNNGLPQDIVYNPNFTVPFSTLISTGFSDASATLNTFFSVAITVSTLNMRPGL
jgi:hypothetical protein